MSRREVYPRQGSWVPGNTHEQIRGPLKKVHTHIEIGDPMTKTAMIEYFRLAWPKKSDRLAATKIASDDDFEVSVCPIGIVASDDKNFVDHWDGQRLRTDLAVSVKHNKRDELLIWVWLTPL